MIRDRGKIKWTSLMLPEHVKMLREWAEEDSYKAKPQLDEQQLEEMNETIFYAMEADRELAITYHTKHDYVVLVGKVHYYHEIQKQLRLVDTFEGIHCIDIKDIIDAREV
jgi:hypothetical protein